MIYTITANPAIDYVVTAKNIELGTVNRMNTSIFLPGGKGINVSRILQQLDIPTTALGFIGGFTGAFIQEQLQADGLQTCFTPIQDTSRLNVKLHEKVETELNGLGPCIRAEEVADFQAQLKQLQPGDVVVMSGSLPRQLPETFYQDLIPLIHAQGAEFVIDTTGQALLDTLSAGPLVVKPNHHELAALFHTSLSDLTDIARYGRKLLHMGAQNVLISMAGDGALLITKNKMYHAKAPGGTVVNSVGAGDAMLAGFTGTYATTQDLVQSFKIGLACGSATAFTKDLAQHQQIIALLNQIHISEFSDFK